MKRYLYFPAILFTFLIAFIVINSTLVYAQQYSLKVAGSFSPTGDITYHSSVIAANGNPILIKASTKSKDSVNLYYDFGQIGIFEEDVDTPIDLIALGMPISGSILNGFDLSTTTIIGGSYNKSIPGSTNITMVGGIVKNIFGGGFSTGAQANVGENTNVYIGGEAYCSTVYGGGGGKELTPSSTSVSGTSNICIDTKASSQIKSVFGGSYSNSGTTMDTFITIKNGNIANIYGGSLVDTSGKHNVRDTSITVLGGKIGSIFGSGLIGVNTNTTATAENSRIQINDGTIHGSVVSGGCAPSSNLRMRRTGVTGNAEITVTGGTFLGNSKSPELIGGSLADGNCNGRIDGGSKITVSGGSFPRVDKNLPVISGGGCNATGIAAGNLGVGKSEIYISGGDFSAPILLDGWAKTTPAFSDSATFYLSGGTLREPISVLSSESKIDGIHICGGSLAANTTGITPTVSKQDSTPLYQATPVLESSTGVFLQDAAIQTMKITSDTNYNLTDVTTDKNGKVHLYFPEKATITEFTSGGKRYIGSLTVASDDSATGVFTPAVASPVTGVTISPSSISTNTETLLTASVNPQNASYDQITLSIFEDGGTQSTLSGNSLLAKSPGTVTILVTVTSADFPPYSQKVEIAVTGGGVIQEPDGDFLNIYANGNPLLVTDATNGCTLYSDIGSTLGALDSGDILIDVINPNSQINLYGSGKDDNVPDSPITVLGGVVGNITGSYITIHGGIVEGFVSGTGSATMQITGGTLLSGIQFETPDLSKLYISGGNIKNSHIVSLAVHPTISPNDATPVYPTVFTMNCTPGDKINSLTTTPVCLYGLTDIFADEGSRFTAYLPANTRTTEIFAGGRRYFNSDGVLTNAGLSSGTLLYKDFVPVTSVSLDNTETTIGTPLTLTPKVEPEDADKKDVTWKILDAGPTGASLKDNQIVASYPGTITLQAVIIGGLANGQDYYKNFSITITKPEYAFTLSAYGVDFGSIPPIHMDVNQSIQATNTGSKPFLFSYNPSAYCNISLPSSPIAPGEKSAIIISPKDNLPLGSYKETITIKAGSAVATVNIEFNIHYFLEFVPLPRPINSIASGAPKTAEGLGLPNSLPVVCSGENMYLPVRWDVDGCKYNPDSREFQEFTIQGALVLPPEIENPTGMQTTVTISVTLNCLLENNKVRVLGKFTNSPSLSAPNIATGEPSYDKLVKQVSDTMEIISAYNLTFTGKMNGSAELHLPAQSHYSNLNATIFQLLPTGDIISHPVTMDDDGAKIMLDTLSPVVLAVTKQQTESISTPAELNKAIKKAGSVPTVITLDNNIHFTPQDAPLTLYKDSHITLIGAGLHLEKQEIEIPTGSYLSLQGILELIITDSKVINNSNLHLTNLPVRLNNSLLTSSKKLSISHASLSGNMGQLVLTGGNASIQSSTFTSLQGECIISAQSAENLTLNDLTFADCEFSSSALNLSKIDSVQISDCRFMNLTSNGQGVIYCEDSSIEIKDSPFVACSASSGGALYLSGTSSALVEHCRFENCSANSDSGMGGAICTAGSSRATVSGSTFTGCKAAYGGAIAMTQNSKAQLTDTELCQNTGILGGAIALGTKSQTPDSLLFTSAWIHNNKAESGGGIFVDDGTPLRLENAVVSSNNNGGISFGTSGYGSIYDKLAVFDNNNQNGKEDVYVAPTQGNSPKTFSISGPMLGGGQHNWSQPEDVYTDNPCLQPLSMFSQPTSDDKGKALAAATVYIEENSADFGGGVAISGILVSGASSKSKALLKKTDAGTGMPLPGALFGLYSKDNEKIGEYVTDQKGEIHDDSLTIKESYYFTELQAPPGYVIKEEGNHYPFIYGDKTVHVTNMPVVPKLTVRKSIRTTDIQNNEIAPNLSTKFAFTFEIKGDGTYEYVVDGLTQTISSGDVFYLQSDQIATFIDLPSNAQYTITEHNYYDEPIDGNHYISYGKNTSGTISQGGYLQVSFENVLVPDELLDDFNGVGSLAVVSRIHADDRDVDKSKYFETTAVIGKNPKASFAYQIVTEPYYSLDDPLGKDTTPVDSPVPDVPMYKSQSNVITAHLNHKSALLIYEIPVGSEYTVSQLDYTHMDGYSIDSTYNTTGVILPDKLDSKGKVTSRARTDFINRYTRPVTFQINVTKRWAEKEQPPSEVLVDFSANQTISSLTLTAENHWQDAVEVEKSQYESLNYALQGKEADGYAWELVFDNSSIKGGDITHNWELKDVSNSKSPPGQEGGDESDSKRVITTTTEVHPTDGGEENIPWNGKRITSFAKPQEELTSSDHILLFNRNTVVIWLWTHFASTAMLVGIAASFNDKRT